MAQYKGAASEAGRAMQIKKRREREQEEMEQKKRKLEETLKINKIENKFAVHYDAVEQQLKVNIISVRQFVNMNPGMLDQYSFWYLN